MAKCGIWSPDSQTKMIKIGWRTKGYGGMTSKSPWEQQQIRRITPTWSHSHFGCSGAKSLRSRAVMIPVTFHTTGNCLARQTFRSKISGYGDFRNGSFWASKQCLGSCTVQYSGQYKSTDGFQQAECSGDIQSANKIGFWCDSQYFYGEGLVLMIGGGGSSCGDADHGIGITETGAASFIEAGGSATESRGTEYDFGYNATTGSAPSQSYSLNLWICWKLHP